jgi:RNA polymerase sigma-70 factor (ECF subfamily)
LTPILQNKKIGFIPTFLKYIRPSDKIYNLNISFGTNDTSLVKHCKNGDAKAQYKIYKLYSKAMYNLAIRIIGEKGSAEDILQDSFIKVFSDINNLKDDKAFGAWLKRIVINRSLDEVRKRKYVFSGLESVSEHQNEFIEEVDDSVDPEIVHHLIKKLPDGAREILVLRAIEGFKHSEIAEKLNISESTAKTQFFRAKQILAKMLKELENENGNRKISERKQVNA